jgi:hypothetical protein
MSKQNGMIRQFKEQWEEERRRHNLEWAKSMDKWGDLDYLVYSNLSELVEEKFNTEIVDITLRHVKRLKDGQTKTFGVIAVSEEYIFLNKANNRLRREVVDELLGEISLFWEHFPMYRNKKLVGVLTCIYYDEPAVTYAEQNGFLVAGVGLELLEVKNRADFEPKIWLYNP